MYYSSSSLPQDLNNCWRHFKEILSIGCQGLNRLHAVYEGSSNRQYGKVLEMLTNTMKMDMNDNACYHSHPTGSKGNITIAIFVQVTNITEQ